MTESNSKRFLLIAMGLGFLGNMDDFNIYIILNLHYKLMLT